MSDLPAAGVSGTVVCGFGDGTKAAGAFVVVNTFPPDATGPQTVAADRALLESMDPQAVAAGGVPDMYADHPEWGQDAFWHFNPQVNFSNEYGGGIVTPGYVISVTIEPDRVSSDPSQYMSSTLTELGKLAFG